MAQSFFVEGTTRLRPYRIEPKAYVRYTFGFGLAASLARVFVIFTALAAFFLWTLGTQGLTFAVGMYLALVLLVAARYLRLVGVTRNPLNRTSWVERWTEFDEKELRQDTELGSHSTIPFAMFVKAAEYGGYLFVYLNATHFVPIPLSAFETPADLERFRDRLRRQGALKERTRR